MIIRKLKNKDVKEVIKLCLEVWPDLTKKELENHFKKKIRNKDNEGFVAIDNKKIIGFIGFSKRYFRDSDYLEWVFVDKNYRGRGIAETLIKKFEQDARRRKSRRIFSTTIKKNKAAMKMHKKLGYQQAGYVWNLWEEGDKEIIFSKKLG